MHLHSFDLSASQTFKVLVNIRDNTSWKKVLYQHEWMITLKAIDAAS